MITGSNTPTWSSMTYMDGYDSAGYAPCSAVVSSADGGYLAVLNSVGTILFTSPPFSANKGGGLGYLNATRTVNQVNERRPLRSMLRARALSHALIVVCGWGAGV